MNKFIFLIKVATIYFFCISVAFSSKLSFFDEGKILFDNNKFDKSKILFEKDIVFNPKNGMSYLYLAKIFLQKENDQEQEINLNSVLLLDPHNEEALYMLILLKIKFSDYKIAEDLIEKFNLICKSFCSKTNEIKDSLDKILAKNAKSNN